MKAIVVFLVGVFLAFSEHRTVLEQVEAGAVLRVAIREDLGSYYRERAVPAGFEFALVRRFAEDLGARLEIIPATSPATLYANLRRRRVHFAAGLLRADGHPCDVHFTPAHRGVRFHVVYPRGTRRPREPAALEGKRVAVLAGGAGEGVAAGLRKRFPDVRWETAPLRHPNDVLAAVVRRDVDFGLVDSADFAVKRPFFPELRVGFDPPAEGAAAWAFSRRDDDSLYRAALVFLHRLHRSGELERLEERHFGHLGQFDYVTSRRRLRYIRERLPRYEADFRRAGERHGIDWRLLAAIGYRESLWNPDARSRTGVRGIMMLTRATARQVGVADREDPRQSIEGGARYFAGLEARLPRSVREPDRTWFALAAYNLGYGHLRDARILARAAGEDPDRWEVLERWLGRLTRKRWHEQTRHGYARGYEALRFVEAVRRTHDVLRWHARFRRAASREG